MKFIDIKGEKFGKLTVVECVYPYKGRWKCLCDCGKEKTVRGTDLKTGNTTSCGCLHSQRMSKMRKGVLKEDLTGREFKHWTVVRFYKLENGYSYWVCRCVCGKRKVVARAGLISGKSKSCGCRGQRRRVNPIKYLGRLKVFFIG